jgi:GTP cyclohydrolase I
MKIQRHHAKLYGVPRGGIAAAYAVAQQLTLQGMIGAEVVDKLEDAGFVIDDLIDSGSTMNRFFITFPTKPFYALFDKRPWDSKVLQNPLHGKWLVFPWERAETEEDKSADDIVVRMLQRIGEDPTREGLKETPKRVVKAWSEWYSGYGQRPEDVLKTFVDGAENYSGDEMVIVSGIPVYSMCEHHMAPFFGEAAVGYIPSGKIVGLSKLHRLVDMFARRLQVQERLTNQIADTLVSALEPRGVGVLIRARHLCMESRGVRAANSTTTTSAVRGVLLDKPEARAEFLELVRDR